MNGSYIKFLAQCLLGCAVINLTSSTGRGIPTEVALKTIPNISEQQLNFSSSYLFVRQTSNPFVTKGKISVKIDQKLFKLNIPKGHTILSDSIVISHSSSYLAVSTKKEQNNSILLWKVEDILTRALSPKVINIPPSSKANQVYRISENGIFIYLYGDAKDNFIGSHAYLQLNINGKYTFHEIPEDSTLLCNLEKQPLIIPISHKTLPLETLKSSVDYYGRRQPQRKLTSQNIARERATPTISLSNTRLTKPSQLLLTNGASHPLPFCEQNARYLKGFGYVSSENMNLIPECVKDSQITYHTWNPSSNTYITSQQELSFTDSFFYTTDSYFSSDEENVSFSEIKERIPKLRNMYSNGEQIISVFFEEEQITDLLPELDQIVRFLSSKELQSLSNLITKEWHITFIIFEPKSSTYKKIKIDLPDSISSNYALKPIGLKKMIFVLHFNLHDDSEPYIIDLTNESTRLLSSRRLCEKLGITVRENEHVEDIYYKGTGDKIKSGTYIVKLLSNNRVKYVKNNFIEEALAEEKNDAAVTDMADSPRCLNLKNSETNFLIDVNMVLTQENFSKGGKLEINGRSCIVKDILPLTGSGMSVLQLSENIYGPSPTPRFSRNFRSEQNMTFSEDKLFLRHDLNDRINAYIISQALQP